MIKAIPTPYKGYQFKYCPICSADADHEHPLLIEAMKRARNAKF